MINFIRLFFFATLALKLVSCHKGNNFNFPLQGIEVSKVLSSFYVGYSAIEKDNKLYMAYYDSIHQMTLATCDLLSGELEYEVLPSKIGWDSHNYVTMAFDKNGYLHVAGNMHATPLVYFQSKNPYDIHSMCLVDSMVGLDEERMTYPAFMDSPDGNLIFHYRTGGSGNGSEIYNKYNLNTKKWSRLLDKHLIDGEGKRNAYMQDPVLGKDGFYHLIWVWRETADCSTNHTLSYARSKDLIHWESISGEQVELPITLDKTVLYVDDTPVKGGLFNPGIRLGFDSKDTPVIGYHKYDKQGNNQLFVARYENGRWHKKQLTNWQYRWQFEGMGSMKLELDIASPKILRDGKMAFGYNHIKEGRGEVVFDEKTLQTLGFREFTSDYPQRFEHVVSSFPGMQAHVMVCGDYLLRWESLPANRDQKPQGNLPPSSKLMLYKWR